MKRSILLISLVCLSLSAFSQEFSMGPKFGVSGIMLGYLENLSSMDFIYNLKCSILRRADHFKSLKYK